MLLWVSFLNAKVLKKVTSFSKSSNLLFTLVLKRQDDWISFSVLPTRLFQIAGPQMGIWNLHLCNLICGFLQFPLEKHVGYKWEGWSIFTRNDNGQFWFLFCAWKQQHQVSLVYIHWLFPKTQKVFSNGKICFYYVFLLKYGFVDCLAFVNTFCVCYPY